MTRNPVISVHTRRYFHLLSSPSASTAAAASVCVCGHTFLVSERRLDGRTERRLRWPSTKRRTESLRWLWDHLKQLSNARSFLKVTSFDAGIRRCYEHFFNFPRFKGSCASFQCNLRLNIVPDFDMDKNKRTATKIFCFSSNTQWSWEAFWMTVAVRATNNLPLSSSFFCSLDYHCNINTIWPQPQKERDREEDEDISADPSLFSAKIQRKSKSCAIPDHPTTWKLKSKVTITSLLFINKHTER